MSFSQHLLRTLAALLLIGGSALGFARYISLGDTQSLLLVGLGCYALALRQQLHQQQAAAPNQHPPQAAADH